MAEHEDQQMNAFIRALVGRPPRQVDEDQDDGDQQQPGQVVDMNTRIRRAAGYGDDAA